MYVEILRGKTNIRVSVCVCVCAHVFSEGPERKMNYFLWLVIGIYCEYFGTFIV